MMKILAAMCCVSIFGSGNRVIDVKSLTKRQFIIDVMKPNDNVDKYHIRFINKEQRPINIVNVMTEEWNDFLKDSDNQNHNDIRKLKAIYSACIKAQAGKKLTEQLALIIEALQDTAEIDNDIAEIIQSKIYKMIDTYQSGGNNRFVDNNILDDDEKVSIDAGYEDEESDDEDEEVSIDTEEIVSESRSFKMSSKQVDSDITPIAPSPTVPEKKAEIVEIVTDKPMQGTINISNNPVKEVQQEANKSSGDMSHSG